MSAPLKRFVIERDMPGVGKRTPEELAGAAKARRRRGVTAAACRRWRCRRLRGRRHVPATQ